MLTHSNSGVYTMETNNNSSWFKNNQYMLTSNVSMVLHDPECQKQCCSYGFSESIQLQAPEPSNYNDLEQLLDVEECNSVESIVTPITSKNCLFYSNIESSDVQVQQYQGVVDQTLEDKIETEFSNLSYNEQANGEEENPCFRNSIAKQYQKGNCKGALKRKRKRTIFTTEQIIAMEEVFKKRPYVSREERVFLTQKLNVSEKVIKIWFQNRRRVTEKREKDHTEIFRSDSAVEEAYDTYMNRLDYIEEQINHNADEHGFVTLDSRAFTDLVNVIDTVLCQSFDCDNSLQGNSKNTSQSENYLMYEPISPESLPDENREIENISKWIPLKPEESLQRLIDIQDVLLYRH